MNKGYSRIWMQHSYPKANKNERKENFLRFPDLLLLSVFLGTCITMYLYTVANLPPPPP